MATVLTDVSTIAANATFQSRIAAGIAWKANFIGTQVLALGDAATATDKLRLKLARDIMLAAGTATIADAFTWAVAADPNIADANATDEDILSTIDAVWNVIAGVTV